MGIAGTARTAARTTEEEKINPYMKSRRNSSQHKKVLTAIFTAHLYAFYSLLQYITQLHRGVKLPETQMKRKWRMAVLANIKDESLRQSRELPSDAYAEFERIKTVQPVRDVIEKDGHETKLLLTNGIAIDKVLTKRIWRDDGLPVAPFQEFATGEESLAPELEFPLFVKPVREGSGMGIDENSIVHSEAEMRERF